MGRSFDSLKVEEQILRYRQLAKEALTIASGSSDKSVQAAYLVMASDWHLLAADLEHDLETAAAGEAPPPVNKSAAPKKTGPKAGGAQRHRR